MKAFFEEKRALARAGCRKGNSTFYISSDPWPGERTAEAPRPSGASAERHSFLQFAVLHFRDGSPLGSTAATHGESTSGTAKLLEYLTGKRSIRRGRAPAGQRKELTDNVGYSPFPIVASLLKLDSDYLNRLAVDSFAAIMRYMGDLPLDLHQTEVECVYTVLVICHHHPALRDEIFCQIMKQTTNNNSLNPDSRIRGWRLLAFLLAFFKCSESLMPFLKKYLESAATDPTAHQATVEICIRNLNQTVKYGGRRNVPAEHEVNAVLDGTLSKQQNYFLPGGLPLILATTSSTVVGDILRCICNKMGITNEPELSEFSLYCLVEGDQYTMPLERDEYILDLLAELERNENQFYLVFCRSVWYYELRLNSELYIDMIFNQIVPDYLEGYLMVVPLNCKHLPAESVEEIARMAHLLHKAKGKSTEPTELDVMHLLPKPVLHLEKESAQCIKSREEFWEEMTALNATEAKAQFLELLNKWSLFGSCFFGVKMLENGTEEEYMLAVNKSGVNILHLNTHETIWRFNFASAHAPYNITDVDGTTYADIEFGDKNFKKTIRLQVDHAHEISRLIQQYTLIQDLKKESENMEQNCPKVMIKE